MKRVRMLLLAGILLLGGLFFWTGTTEAAGKEPGIQWVYVDGGENGSQAVVFSVTSGDLDSAVLTYRQGGRKATAKAAEIRGGSIGFLLSGGKAAAGDLVSLKLTRGEETYTLDLEQFRRKADTSTVNLTQDGGAKTQLYSGSAGVVARTTNQIRSALRVAESQAPVRSGRARSGNLVIVLDPGHGGSEVGAMRTWNGVTYQESLITMKIARAMKAELETYAGVKVYMTRNSEVYMSLAERVDYAASVGATALISLHINSTGTQSTTATGAEVMVSSGNYRPAQAQETKTIALQILEGLSKIGFSNRGLVYRLSETGDTYPNGELADYYGIVRRSVLAGFPGMIVEHGFVSNPSDCKRYYGSDAKIAKLGTADAAAVAAYYGLKKQTDTPSADTKLGWFRKNNKVYYRNADATLALGLTQIKGKTYYFNDNGVRLSGWRAVGEDRYYFSPTSFAAVKGWKVIKGRRYYFNSDGVRQTGIFQVGSDWYYAGKKCYRETGWKTVDGKTYYFKPTNGKMIRGRSAVIRGKTYVFGEDGALVTVVRG